MTDRPVPPLRYVVLRHEGVDDPHFDLMFETEPHGDLTTWRSDVWPLEDRTPLVRIGAHRREYLDYEGPLSGNRGTVRRVASGTFQWLMRGQSLTFDEAGSTWRIGGDPKREGAIAIRA